MKTSTTIRSPGALALGLFFTVVTARTIFDDVWHGAEVTVAHLNAAAALVAAIASGHLAWPCLKSGRIPAALGLAAIFLAATTYIVTSAGARNAEVANAKAAMVLKTNEERATLKGKLAEAEADAEEADDAHDKAKAEAARECASGKGRKCDGRTATRDYAAKDLEKAESHAALLRGKLSLLGPEVQPFAGYHHAAKVFEAAGLGEAVVIEARLELLLPFALVLISELGTLVFLGMALGHRGNTRNRPDTAQAAATETATAAGNDNGCDSCPPPKGGNRATVAAGNLRTVASKAAAEADVIRLVARGEQLPSQDVLAARWGIHKGTASKWLQDFERRGLIARKREGRAKRVAAA